MNILITGINGFVGRYLIDILPYSFNKENYKLHGTYLGMELKDENINMISLDLTDRESTFKVIKSIKPDYVFHLAAQSSVSLSWKNPNLTFDVNVNGTINLLDAIREVNSEAKILMVGSSEEYGKIKKSPVDEKHEVNPMNPYAVSKVTQEMIAKVYVNAYKMNIVMTRSFNHIGPMQTPVFVVADWAKQIAEIELNIKEPIINVGNLEVKRDFADVRDIVRGYTTLIKQGVSGEIYNIGSGKSYELKYILGTLLSFTKKSIIVNVDKAKLRPAENPEIQCDNGKIYNLCGWKAEYSLEDTLLDVLNYWRGRITDGDF